MTYKGEATLDELREENARLREALEFYAETSNWRSPSKGFALQYDPEPSPVRKDGGKQAREALNQDPRG